MRNQVWRIWAAAKRFGGQERGVGLDQYLVSGSECESLTERMSTLESDGACKGEEPPPGETDFGKVKIARETVQHRSFGGAHSIECLEHLTVCVPIVNLQGEIELFGDTNVRLECLELGIPPRLWCAKKIKSSLTNRADLGFGSEGPNALEMLVQELLLLQGRGGIGMQGNCSSDALILFRESHSPITGVEISAHLDNAPNPNFTCQVEALLGREHFDTVFKLQVRVIVDDGKRQRLRRGGMLKVASLGRFAFADEFSRAHLLVVCFDAGEERLQLAEGATGL